MSELSPRVATNEFTPGVSAGGPLENAIAEFAAAAVRADGIDPIITELVRLRCAQYHDCRLCGSFRVQAALDAGFEESMQKAIGDYENSDFSPAAKAALGLCDAIIMRPGEFEPGLKQELRMHFSDAQISELCVDVMKWSQQKALVALRIEPPASETHLTQLIFDESGHPVFGEPLGT
ncbi:MAG: carboxymuconolactone decarboxylase family protein [Woeseiaceae bacterium]|nr:carboxymuconolactone decarboxylase family protein [Woeseiaceae bacterium]